MLKEYYKEIYSQEECNSTISEDINQLYKWSFRKVEFFKHLSLKLNCNYTRSMVTRLLVLIFPWILLIFEHFDAKFGNSTKEQIVGNKTKKMFLLTTANSSKKIYPTPSKPWTRRSNIHLPTANQFIDHGCLWLWITHLVANFK